VTKHHAGIGGSVVVTATVPGHAPARIAEAAVAEAAQSVLHRLALPGTARAAIRTANGSDEPVQSLVVGSLVPGLTSSAIRSSDHAETTAFALTVDGSDPGSSAQRLVAALAVGDQAVAAYLRWWAVLTLAETPEDLLNPESNVIRAVWADCVEVLGFGGLRPDAPPNGFRELLSAIVRAGGTLAERGLIGRLAHEAESAAGTMNGAAVPATMLAERVLAATGRLPLVIAADRDTLAALVTRWYRSAWLRDGTSGLADWEHVGVGDALGLLAIPAVLTADGDVPSSCFVLRLGNVDVDAVRIFETSGDDYLDDYQTASALQRALKRLGHDYGARLLDPGALASLLDGMFVGGEFTHTVWFARGVQASETITAEARSMIARGQGLDALPVLLFDLAASDSDDAGSPG
jgi:hypothetical protein